MYKSVLVSQRYVKCSRVTKTYRGPPLAWMPANKPARGGRPIPGSGGGILAGPRPGIGGGKPIPGAGRLEPMLGTPGGAEPAPPVATDDKVDIKLSFVPHFSIITLASSSESSSPSIDITSCSRCASNFPVRSLSIKSKASPKAPSQEVFFV